MYFLKSSQVKSSQVHVQDFKFKTIRDTHKSHGTQTNLTTKPRLTDGRASPGHVPGGAVPFGANPAADSDISVRTEVAPCKYPIWHPPAPRAPPRACSKAVGEMKTRTAEASKHACRVPPAGGAACAQLAVTGEPGRNVPPMSPRRERRSLRHPETLYIQESKKSLHACFVLCRLIRLEFQQTQIRLDFSGKRSLV